MESYPGAWQRNDELLPAQNVLANSTVFRCITLIAADIAKMRLRLMELDADGIGKEAESSAFSPLLEEPNYFQNSTQFFECWMFSKLTNGNTYVLKRRDNRNVVNELFVLDPNRVRPLVSPAPQNEVYYEIRRDDLSGQAFESVTVPRSEVIHDRMNAIHHPLWGLSPIYASHLSASQAQRILKFSDKFFSNAARPSGFLSAPGMITQATADRLKEAWETKFSGENQGKIAVGGDGLTFTPMSQNAVDAELVKQLELSDKAVCRSFGVPGFKVSVGSESEKVSIDIETLNQIYFSDCIQVHAQSIEKLMTSGIELPANYYLDFDTDNLLRMDMQRRSNAYSELVKSGIVAANEARAIFNYGPVKGGNIPRVQQQMIPLDQPNPSVTQAAAATPKQETIANPDQIPAKELHTALRVIRGGLN